MAETEVLEGRWEEILSRNASHLAGKWVRVYIADESEDDFPVSMEAALQRITQRSDEEIATARKRIFKASPVPRPVPEGETLESVLMGHWPGEETDDEINAALRKLS